MSQVCCSHGIQLRTLQKGSTGIEVKHLQHLLNAYVHPTPPLVEDGIFGSKTEAAVRTFQGTRHLVVDGIVGVRTWTALGEQAKRPKSTPSPGGPRVSYGRETWREIVAYLNSHGVSHWTPSYGQTVGGKHAPTSFHYSGTAVDLDPSVAIFKALEPFARGPNWVLAELFLAGSGSTSMVRGSDTFPITRVICTLLSESANICLASSAVWQLRFRVKVVDEATSPQRFSAWKRLVTSSTTL